MANRLKGGLVRVGGGLAVLIGTLFGARGVVPVEARDVFTGRNIDLNGSYTCDCRNPYDKTCICIVGS